MSTPQREPDLIKQCYVILEPITPKVNAEFSSELKRAINERNLLTTKTRKRVTEALEEIENENHESTRRAKRRKILAEILESEENYIRQLEVITEFFIKPSRDKELLGPKDFDILFSDITTIHRINRELLEELRQSANNVGKAFSKIAPFFKSYSFYASGFKRSLDILKNCHRDNPKFERFLEMQETRPEVQSKLSALLIVPIQRVPRYKLLLMSLFNLTLPTEEDYDALSDSLIKVENAADHINKIIKEQENMQRLIELQRCLQKGEPNVITPGRKLIKEGALYRLTQKPSHAHKMHVVLTNDIIMFCRMKRDELKVNSLKCCGIYPLGICRVQIVRDKGAFKVTCQDEETVLYDDSYAETMNWAEEIECVIETLVNDRKTLRKTGTVRRPVKRKHLNEYNEVGLSPGKKLRKRKSTFEEQNNGSRQGSLLLAKRRPLRTTFNLPSEREDANVAPSSFVTSTILHVRDKEHCDNSKSEIEASKEIFVFGKTQSDSGFSFKMNQWLCGIGMSFKKLLGFK